MATALPRRSDDSSAPTSGGITSPVTPWLQYTAEVGGPSRLLSAKAEQGGSRTAIPVITRSARMRMQSKWVVATVGVSLHGWSHGSTPFARETGHSRAHDVWRLPGHRGAASDRKSTRLNSSH